MRTVLAGARARPKESDEERMLKLSHLPLFALWSGQTAAMHRWGVFISAGGLPVFGARPAHARACLSIAGCQAVPLNRDHWCIASPMKAPG